MGGTMTKDDLRRTINKYGIPSSMGIIYNPIEIEKCVDRIWKQLMDEVTYPNKET